MITSQIIIERSLRDFADRTAVIGPGGTLTYRQLAQRSARLANALLSFGASTSRAVAILLPNDTQYIEVDVACTRAGVLRVGISTRLTVDECRFILRHSRATVLVTDSKQLALLGADALEDVSKVLLVDRDAGTASQAEKICSYEATLAAAADELRAPRAAGDDPAYLLYTSGTTGRPKGAMHTQGSRAAGLLNMLACEMRADARSVMAHCGSLTHGSGSKVLSFFALGAANLLLPKFDPRDFARAIGEHSVSHTFVVPTMLQMLLEAGPQVQQAVRSMRQISFGGAPITNALFGRVVEGFGANLTQVYGTSEAPHPVTILQPEDYCDLPDPGVLGEVAGRVGAGSEVLIVDETGAPLPDGAEGELLIRADHVMKGYWQDETASAEAFTPDGFYRSGDVAVIDESGFVSFRDRKRDLVITGGLNVYPSEVERVIAEHPGVAEVAVIGYPDDYWGESVMAIVVCRGGPVLTGPELLAWLDGRIAGYKRPRRVEFVQDLPKGSTGKVLKRELKNQFWQGRERRV